MNRPRLRRLLARLNLGALVFRREFAVDFEGLERYMAELEEQERLA